MASEDRLHQGRRFGIGFQQRSWAQTMQSRVQTVMGLLFMTVQFVAAQNTSPSGSAQAQPAARPVYLVDRSEEDWSSLRNSSNRMDLWDPVKYIPLSADRTSYVTLGGEIRPFYEFYRNYNWGAGPQDDNGFYVQRLMFHSDFHMSRRARVFFEIQSGMEAGRNGGPRPGRDEDKADVNEAFLELYNGFRSERPIFTLRVGRQEMNYGDGSLLAIREGLNVRRAFDGAKIILRIANWRIDTFALKPVQTKRGYFDDAPDHAQTLWGFYASSHAHLVKFFGQLEPYYIALDRKLARFDQGLGRDQRHTVGLHTINQNGGFTYEFGGALQFGRFGSGDIRAWKYYETVSYKFEKVRFRPLVGLNAAMSSGDKDPRNPDLQTFHPLFPKGLYYGYIDSTGSLNAIVLHPRVNLRLTKPLSLNTDTFLFWRQRTTDGIYSQPGFFLRTGQLSGARFLGSLFQVELVWRVDQHTTVTFQAAHYAVGQYFRDTPPAKDTTYFSTKVSYKF